VKALVLKGDDPNTSRWKQSRVKTGKTGWRKPLYTPLHFAALYGNTEVFSWLIQRGGDINARDTHGKTCLHVAAKYGQVDIVRVILLEDADIEAKSGGR
jgi:hypothetical protein